MQYFLQCPLLGRKINLNKHLKHLHMVSGETFLCARWRFLLFPALHSINSTRQETSCVPVRLLISRRPTPRAGFSRRAVSFIYTHHRLQTAQPASPVMLSRVLFIDVGWGAALRTLQPACLSCQPSVPARHYRHHSSHVSLRSIVYHKWCKTFVS